MAQINIIYGENTKGQKENNYNIKIINNNKKKNKKIQYCCNQ